MDRYDVKWATPGEGPSDSMPLGNGDIGLNVWTLADGAVLFYISKTDAWNENGRLLKLGRVRITLTTGTGTPITQATQRLRLSTGEVELALGEGPSQLQLRVWVDANAPVVRMEACGSCELGMKVALEVWRDAERAITGEELHSAYGLSKGPAPVVEQPDVVVSADAPAGGDGEIVWYHRNDNSIWRENLEMQGLGGFCEESSDPLLGRTFGGVLRGAGLASTSPTSLESRAPRKAFSVAVCLLTEQTASASDWVARATALADTVATRDIAKAREAHADWWKAFWERSWIHAYGSPQAEALSQTYALQRFISACAGRGAYPIKFNGSIFTVDPADPGKPFDADFRMWGGPYWFQNTRLAYWPMLASGDFDLMRPLFDMYIAALPLAKARTRAHFGHGGACFPETMYFWGAFPGDCWGWTRGEDPQGPLYAENTYIRYSWSGALELLAMAIDYCLYTGDADFMSTVLLPLAAPVLEFYRLHYPRDEEGLLRIEPAAALENQDAVNPLPDIAGLQCVTAGLLALMEGYRGAGGTTGSAPLVQEWQQLRASLPPLPTAQADGGAGRKLLAAAELTSEVKNSENPELYAIFPYRLLGLSKGDLDTGLNTFEGRGVKGNAGWRQDPIQAAYLGLAEVARKMVVERAIDKDAASRFPAFWGPNFDWVPDQDHGGVLVMALQAMVLQTVARPAEPSDLALVLPAWPADWNVDFKLRGLHGAVVKGTYEAGAMQELSVSGGARPSATKVCI